MADFQLGDRVGAILGANEEDKLVRFLGWGRYEGRAVPKEAIGFMADALVEMERDNPKIVLDSGQVVYGCECWWGSERAIQDKLSQWHEQGYEVVSVDIDQIRTEYRQKQDAAES